MDVDVATAYGIPVGNTPGVLTDATADFAFTLLMAAARRIVEAVDYVRAVRRLQARSYPCYPGPIDEDIDARFYATYKMEFGEERDAELRAVQQALIDEIAGVPVMEVTPQVVMGPRVGDIPSLATYAPYDWKRAWVRSDG